MTSTLRRGIELMVALAALSAGAAAAHADQVLATATAAVQAVPPRATRATVRHVPPAEAAPHQALRLIALVDDAWVEARLLVRYRPIGAGGPYREQPFERSSAGGYFATIPGIDVAQPGVEYYVVGVHGDGREEPHYASSAAPHPVRVEPDAELRWVEAERRRLDDRLSVVSTRIEAQSFGGVGEQPDRYWRAEIDWTHRLIGPLYSFSLGFGLLDGTTPSGLDADDLSVDRAVRYGYGGVKLRLARWAWLDGRAIMGFGRDGFIAGGGGSLTLGQEWRSCVKAGAEYTQELGKTAFVRLQWDTVGPFLMGATATATDLPNAVLASGSSIAFDVSYPVTSQLALTATVSFAARGNRPGGFGGGLATRFEF